MSISLPSNHSALEAAGIPLACLSCTEEEEEIPGYGKNFEVDFESDLLGSVADYGRQLVISTGRSDWAHDVTEDGESLAGLIKSSWEAVNTLPESKEVELKEGGIKGVYTSALEVEPLDLGRLSLENGNSIKDSKTKAERISILNGSFLSGSDECHSSMMIFPDFTIVHEIPSTKETAKRIVGEYLTERRGGSMERSEESGNAVMEVRSWALPYHCVVLICSHKKRDKRCHIAAPLLISQFHYHLETNDFEVDERGDDHPEGPSLETYAPEVRATKLRESLQEVNRTRVGVFKCSHIGGHRYAGNVIIYFPNGTSVWYGRVTPSYVGAIVRETIIKGNVIPELLRGGFSIANKPDGIVAW